jgi:hypothetical protein
MVGDSWLTCSKADRMKSFAFVGYENFQAVEDALKASVSKTLLFILFEF